MFVIEAMVQPVPEVDYAKVIFLDTSDDIDKHMHDLQTVNHRVLSVKSRPALDSDLTEMAWDRQGNMKNVDKVQTVVPGEETNAETDTDNEDSSSSQD